MNIFTLAYLYGSLILALVQGQIPDALVQTNQTGVQKSLLDMQGVSLLVHGKKYTPLFARTEEEREVGLSTRKFLETDRAMVFVFDQEGTYPFWMKGMQFSIDIAWLNKKGEVVYVKKRVSPDTYPDAFYPKEKASMVVEVSSGGFDSVQVGDRFLFE
jgi:uncharacterized membrane protein (UPF0127 family)